MSYVKSMGIAPQIATPAHSSRAETSTIKSAGITPQIAPSAPSPRAETGTAPSASDDKQSHLQILRTNCPLLNDLINAGGDILRKAMTAVIGLLAFIGVEIKDLEDIATSTDGSVSDVSKAVSKAWRRGKTTTCIEMSQLPGAIATCSACPFRSQICSPVDILTHNLMARKRLKISLGQDTHQQARKLMRGLMTVSSQPQIFQMVGRLVRLRWSDGDPRVEDMNPDGLKSLILENLRVSYNDDHDKMRPGVPLDGVKHLLRLSSAWKFPVLKGITTHPLVSTAGIISAKEGYMPDTQYYMVLPGQKIPEVPKKPTTEDVAQAKDLIFNELLGDFPFHGQSDKVHALAFALQILLKEHFQTPAPLTLVAGNMPGVGKGKLVDILSIIITGDVPYTIGEAPCDDQWRKLLIATLRETQAIIKIDNIHRPINSGFFAQVLTSAHSSDRILHTSTNITVRNNRFLAATGNNARVSREIARRTLLIELVSGLSDPSSRNDFRHPNLEQWVREERPQLLRALLVILQNWIAKGMPKKDISWGSFEIWAGIIGGIMDTAGITGFLDNRSELEGMIVDDSPYSDLEPFLEAWWDEFQGKDVHASDLVDLAEKADLLDGLLGKGTMRSKETKFGLHFKSTMGRIGEFEIKSKRDRRTGGCLYCLKRIASADSIIPEILPEKGHSTEMQGSVQETSGMLVAEPAHNLHNLKNAPKKRKGKGATKTAKERKKRISGTKEWADENYNFIKGCVHDCLYCYAKGLAIQRKQSTPDAWKNERVRKKALNGKIERCEGTIMFPSTHDISLEHIDETIKFIGRLLAPGNKVLVVMKPHLECITRICAAFADAKDRILFRFTIGSANSDTLRFWEPNAPDYAERLNSIKLAHSQGFRTSVSCEPMLDDRIEDVINDVSPFVSDAIWLGKATRLIYYVETNGGNKAQVAAARALEDRMSDEFIHGVYDRFKDNPMIRWKDSIKKVVGIPLAEEAGLDI